MELLHESLIDHYKSKGKVKGGKHVIKQTLQKKQNEEDQISPYEDFIRN